MAFRAKINLRGFKDKEELPLQHDFGTFEVMLKNFTSLKGLYICALLNWVNVLALAYNLRILLTINVVLFFILLILSIVTPLRESREERRKLEDAAAHH